MSKIRINGIVAIIVAMAALNDPELWLKDGRPDLDSLRDEAEDETIEREERDEAYSLYLEVQSPPESEPLEVVVLMAATDCRVEEGETQTCWGSIFQGVEIKNPELEEEFHADDLPETILVLLGEFTDPDEIESLLRSKRAIRYS